MIMALPQGVVRFHHQEQTVTFAVEGRGTMTNSLPLRRCAEGLLAAGVTQVRVDLRACTYMDSTFLGTILTIKKLLERSQGQLVLITPSLACGRILQQMGLSDVLATQSEPPAEVPWTELSGEPADLPSFKRNVAQAHEELANLPGAAGEQFKAVSRCLAESNKANKPPE
jgi:anti-anti-sigma factor